MAAKYEANWDSLKQYRVPDWFQNDKLGIFIHWGVYAVPAFSNEWYPRCMYLKDNPCFEHHRKKWGLQEDFGYKDFVPMFKAENWDPAEWVDLFKKSGARYIVPVAEHHDGFPMYDCSFTNWNAAQMGPCRDTIADLEAEVRVAGLKFGVSSHRAFNWHYYTFRDDFDNSNAEYSKLYGTPHPDEAPVSYEFILDWYARTQELVEKFNPDVLWFDFGWHRSEFSPWWPRLAAYYYNHAEENGYQPVLQYKDKFPDEVGVLDIERGKLDDLREHYWQTDTSLSYKSWCYIEDDEFRTPASLIHDFVDIVSKNGNLLINVGPRPDGTIPQEAADLLLALGKWLDVNGEAIYGSRPYKTYGEGPTGVPKAFKEQAQQPYTAEDIRFTTGNGKIYAICLGRPGEKLKINSLSDEKVSAVRLLGSDEPIAFSQNTGLLELAVPSTAPCDHAVTFEFTVVE